MTHETLQKEFICYLSLDHSRPLEPQIPDCVEHIHHSLSLEPLNEDAYCYVGPSPTTPSTGERGKERGKERERERDTENECSCWVTCSGQ